LALIVDEPQRVEEQIARVGYELRVSYEESENHALPPPATLFVQDASAIAKTRSAVLMFQELDTGEPSPGTDLLPWPSRRARTLPVASPSSRPPCPPPKLRASGSSA
jgi:hypothetical protein